MLQHFNAKNFSPSPAVETWMSMVCVYTWTSHCDFYSLIDGNITQGKYAQINFSK